MHDNYGYPDFSLLSYTLWRGDYIAIGLYTTITESTPDVRYLNPKKRGCWFPDEVPTGFS